MKHKLLKQLQNQGYAKSTAYGILSGTRKPSLEAIVALKKVVPVEAWLDIRKYIASKEQPQSDNKATHA